MAEAFQSDILQAGPDGLLLDDDIPVLTEVVVDAPLPADGDSLPLLQAALESLPAAPIIADAGGDGIPVLQEALPDKLADLTAFSSSSSDSVEIVLEFDSPTPREPELIAPAFTPAVVELTLDGADILPDLPKFMLSNSEHEAVPTNVVDLARLLTDEILADVEARLEGTIATMVRRHFALVLAETYRSNLQLAMQAAAKDIRQDLRGSISQMVADRLTRIEN